MCIQSNTEDSEGSYLLDIMDQFALEAITDDTELSEGNISKLPLCCSERYTELLE